MRFASRPTLPLLLTTVCFIAVGCATEGGGGASVPTARAQTETPPAKAETPPASMTSATAVPVGFFDAAMAGNIPAVIGAIDAGVTVDATNDQDGTALMLAAFNGHDELVRELLTRGAFISKADALGRTALMYASSGPYAGTVKLLLDHGADPNLTETSEGWTALMFAAGEGNAGVIKVLLEGGADASLKDDDGDAAASHAQRNGHDAVAAALEVAAEAGL